MGGDSIRSQEQGPHQGGSAPADPWAVAGHLFSRSPCDFMHRASPHSRKKQLLPPCSWGSPSFYTLTLLRAQCEKWPTHHLPAGLSYYLGAALLASSLLSALCAPLCTVGLAPLPHLPLLPMTPSSAPKPFRGKFRTKTQGLRNLQTFLLNIRPRGPVGRFCCFAVAPTWQPTRSHTPRNYVVLLLLLLSRFSHVRLCAIP